MTIRVLVGKTKEAYPLSTLKELKSYVNFEAQAHPEESLDDLVTLVALKDGTVYPTDLKLFMTDFYSVNCEDIKQYLRWFISENWDFAEDLREKFITYSKGKEWISSANLSTFFSLIEKDCLEKVPETYKSFYKLFW